MPSVCSVENCGKRVKAKGYCSTHYSRFTSNGDPNLVKKKAKYSDNENCSVENCKNRPTARGMCSRHWQLWRKHGNPNAGKYQMKIRKAVTHTDGTRTCSQCERRLPIDNFHKDKRATDGYRSKCKECRISLVKKWYKENSERQATKEKIRRRANPEKYAEKEALRYQKDKDKRLLLATEHSHLRKARKKETKVERGISKKSLMKRDGTKCHYCKKEMDFSTGSGRKFNRDMATIEHLVPLAKGGEHTFANTVLACRFCNISKNAKSEEDFTNQLKNSKNLKK